MNKISSFRRRHCCLWGVTLIIFKWIIKKWSTKSEFLEIHSKRSSMDFSKQWRKFLEMSINIPYFFLYAPGKLTLYIHLKIISTHYDIMKKKERNRNVIDIIAANSWGYSRQQLILNEQEKCGNRWNSLHYGLCLSIVHLFSI